MMDVATHYLALSDGRRLAYTRLAQSLDIWRMELPAGGTATPQPAPLIVSSKSEMRPQFSLDGSRIAFESSRSGSVMCSTAMHSLADGV